MTEGTVYMGRNADGHHVYADVTIAEGDASRIVEFTDHTSGPSPERVSITFSVLTRKGNPRTAPDHVYVSAGQTPPEDRVIADPASAHTRVIEAAWASQHLNDMHAECMHMTEDMLTPGPDAEVPERYGRPDVQGWRIANVVCPVTGYRWGHAWLAERPDADIVAALRDAIATGPRA